MSQYMSKDEPKTEKSPLVLREEEILAFWQEKQIFRKTLEKNASKGEFTFYDGPPFATGLPHYGHILAGTIKDVIPRYKTMQGYHVTRRWGWDCHGLPIENLIEKELGLKNKKDIEEYGVEKFNRAARESVLRYYADWRKIIPRLGRFVDMDNYYMTMDSNYTESVWWSFKELWHKKLAYEGYKSVHLCPHCGTTLSNFEVNQGYKDITDISVYVKFQLKDENGADVAGKYLLAWTTTPWTLPGNFALAVNSDVDYVQVSVGDAKNPEKFILAESRLKVLKEKYEIEEKFKGSKLLGLSYKPIFDYYLNADLKNKENAWRVYAGDFVTTLDGTGIVHIAPGFGEDDLALAQSENIPFVQHVGTDGKFRKEVIDFVGQDVKPKGDHQKADIEIIKYLAKRGGLFAKEKITHSYPHCWRCDTPLLNYATSSWFVKVTDLKEALVAENKKINWVPSQVGEARFGNWLLGAKDWSVSRQRYWGTSMPVWRCKDCEKIEVLGSIDELKQKVKSSNTYFFMRHGEAEHNVQGVLSTKIENNRHLTEKGKNMVLSCAENLKDKKIDLIYASDFTRTKETAELVAESVGYASEKIIFDKRLREINCGDFDGKPVSEYHAFFADPSERFTKAPPGGETVEEVKKRVVDFILEIDATNKDKNILIVSHDDPIFFMRVGGLGMTRKEILAMPANDVDYLHPGEVKMHHFYRVPRNEKYELDLHRPYIDDVSWPCDCGRNFLRIADVFDAWYDSGSMPYAQNHYPFDDKVFNPQVHKSFPADFIAEGLDQTRGWFYTLLVLSTALFGESAYKNVVVNGLVLAEDGKKMSKSLKNYTEIMPTVDEYGADALRFFLMASPAVKGEEIRFSLKGVDEVAKKLLMRLGNIYAFYALYADGTSAKADSQNILDKWILARLAQTIETVTKSLDEYVLDKAARGLEKFVDDFSTWYLRRSRERFKGHDLDDKKMALATMRYVLGKFVIVAAPFVPFIAEDIYQKVKLENEPESVHLCEWPALLSYDQTILNDMTLVREVVEASLALRGNAGIKVRQPLRSLSTNIFIKNEALLAVIADEVNVKKVLIDKNLSENVLLDLNLTPDLIEEGKLRELVRALQTMRKELKLNPNDKVSMEYAGGAGVTGFVGKYAAEISQRVNLLGMPVHNSHTTGTSVVADDLQLSVHLVKV